MSKQLRVNVCPVTSKPLLIWGFRDECEQMAGQLSNNPASVYTFYKDSDLGWVVSYYFGDRRKEQPAQEECLSLLDAGDLLGLSEFYSSAECWVYSKQSDGEWGARRATR